MRLSRRAFERASLEGLAQSGRSRRGEEQAWQAVGCVWRVDAGRSCVERVRLPESPPSQPPSSAVGAVGNKPQAACAACRARTPRTVVAARSSPPSRFLFGMRRQPPGIHRGQTGLVYTETRDRTWSLLHSIRCECRSSVIRIYGGCRPALNE